MAFRTTRNEDLATIGFSLWMIIGLFVDAYNHVTNPQLETFWTAWHALFYSGFLATAAWLVFLRLRRRPLAHGDIFWAPQGYRPAMYGIALFAVGGIGDAAWHEVFGVETSLDALLSPTHLALFFGLLLIVLAPFRAKWLDDSDDAAPSFPSYLAALMSLSFGTTLVAFFFEYAWASAQTGLVTVPYNPNTTAEEFAAFGFLTIVVTTVILFAPVLLAQRRWQLPPGSVTTYALVINVLVTVGFDKELVGLPAVVAAAVLMDVLIARGAARSLIATLPPLVLWALYFALVDLDTELGWPPEIWGGSIVFAVLTGYAIDRFLELSAVAARRAPDRVDA